MKKLSLSILLLCIAAFCSACTKPLPSGWTPFQVAFFNPVQVFVEDDDVRGARFTVVYGYNVNITGIDVGAIGVSDSMTGIQVNLAYSGPRNMDGIQISSLNEVSGQARGLQLGGVFSHAEDLMGLQIAGAHNRAETVKGVQIGGMVNEAEELSGLQLGIVNCHWSRPTPFQCLPLISWGFGAPDEEEEEEEE